MPPVAPSHWRTESLALPTIILTSALLAFSTLQTGRRLVQDAGKRAVRAALVRESDQIATQSLAVLDERNGCRASPQMPLPFTTCLALAWLGSDSMRVSVRIEPRNRLVGSDSVVFTVVRVSQ